MKPILFCIFLLFCLVESTYAVLWINDFTGQNLGASWSLTNITISNTHTAEATANAGYIATATGQYSTAVVTEGDWGAYNGQYLSLYIWGNGNGAQTLTIEIIEEDEVASAIVNETWSAGATSLSWTGWRYKMFKIPDNFVGSGGNGSWDPDYVAADPLIPVLECRGVKQINFVANADIYIDEIVISNVGSTNGWAREIFPSNDNEDTNIDVTLPGLPPTISAVFGSSASLSNINNKIVVIEEDPTDSVPSNPTINLSSGNGANDGVGGWLVTPSSASYVAGSVYTVFIHPVNASGEPGRCEVITFTTSAPSSTIEKKYKRSLTN